MRWRLQSYIYFLGTSPTEHNGTLQVDEHRIAVCQSFSIWKRSWGSIASRTSNVQWNVPDLPILALTHSFTMQSWSSIKILFLT